MFPRAFIALVLLAFAAASCERPSPKAKAPPATAPVNHPTTEPAASRPTLSYMTINNRAVAFPLAKLRIERKGSRVTALLFSDDPKNAIDANYDGNSFYLEMVLDADDVEDLSSAVWIYRSTTSERDDSPYGIFLHGHKEKLQPMDVRAIFEGGAKPTSVRLAGRFRSYTDSDAPPDIVAVDAQLPVHVIVKKD